MSADNGIYIARFPSSEGWEYRVAYASAIDNCYHGPDDLAHATQWEYFHKPDGIFYNKDYALVFAHLLSNHYDYLEYGINEIEFLDSIMARSQAQKILNTFYKKRE